MKYKNKILTIMTLLVILLLTMSTLVQAVSVGKVYDLEANMNGSQMKLTWSSVLNAAGYNVYVNDTRIGSVNTNEATLIGFSENRTYRLKVAAYDANRNEGIASEEIYYTTEVIQTLAQVKNLEVTQVNGYVTLNWSAVSGASKYQVFVDVPSFGTVNIGEVNTTNAMLKGFKDGQKYGFGIRACKETSGTITCGNMSAMKYCTIDYNQDDGKYEEDYKVGTVKNVKISDITESKATVSWDKLNNADGYEVLLSKNYGSYKTVLDKSGTKGYLSNLDPDTYYRVKVVAYEWKNNQKVYGEESNYRAFYTDEEEVKVGTVKNVKVSNITEDEATVSWDKLSNADGYEVFLSKNYGTYKLILDKSIAKAYLYNLDPDTYYRVKVVAYVWKNNKKVYGEESDYRAFYTDEEVVKVGKVTGVDVYNIKETSATVYWNKLSGTTGYDIYLSKGNGTFKYEGTTTSTSYTITGLNENTSYRVKVVAYKIVKGKEYIGEDSIIKKFTTKKEEVKITVNTVTHLNAQVKNRNEAYLSWWSVDGATGYEIWISENGKAYEKLTWTQNCSYIITSEKLKYSTNYKVKVRAYKNTWNDNKDGYYTTYGSYSVAESFRTERYDSTQNNTSIAKVTNVYAPVYGDGVYLSWNKVYGAAGYEIDFYVPGIGSVTLYADSNYRLVTGVTETDYYYTARIRAYKYVNGIRKYGPYSDPVKFKAAK